ncbi:MAG TPA: polysaccharide deacetylase family protein [Bacteroidia bacterium]|jgi:peptidoglycan/xylan/chitin deacetylase (PgdA/CDA1 family)|nr:polysaccharide deacetylase family protein [Bacteroidia bacterium]
MYLVRPPVLLKKFYPALLWRVDTKEKNIYLTFDDGPHPEITPWVLEELKRAEAKAVFFCVGDNAERYPEICSRILSEGHLCGNHTQNHLNGWNSDSAVYLRNVASCSHTVHSPLFRPPYGRMKKTQAKRLVKHYRIVMWDVLSGDFDRNTSADKCLENTLHYSRPGSIVVFHDSLKAQKNLFAVLPEYLQVMKSRGYSFPLLPY